MGRESSPCQLLHLHQHRLCSMPGADGWVAAHRYLVSLRNQAFPRPLADQVLPCLTWGPPEKSNGGFCTLQVEGMSLRSVEYCVLDEADRLFEMGFMEQVSRQRG